MIGSKGLYTFFCLEAGKKDYWVSIYRAFGLAAILGQQGYIRRALFFVFLKSYLREETP